MTFCQFCGAALAAGAHSLANAATHPVPGASLVVIGQDGTPGRRYRLDSTHVDIGREEGEIVLANDSYLSPRHARLERRNLRFYLVDRSSVNGVYLRLREPVRLRHADLLLVGLEVLRFELVSDAERNLAPAAERNTLVFGSPSALRLGRLCQRTVEGVNRDVYYLAKQETVLGREAGDIVFTSDPYMSRRHAALSYDPADGSFSLRDLQSSNGTYVAIHGEVELVNGDFVRLGQHLFRLDIEDEPGRVMGAPAGGARGH
jgi:pSer/pThr/pTyr-binding forkhead associated (FHA) protein